MQQTAFKTALAEVMEEDKAAIEALKDADQKTAIFVYGTLRQGFGNHEHYLEERSQFVCKDAIIGFELYELHGYPGVKKVEGNATVIGEVYLVGPKTLARIRDLERHYKELTVKTRAGITALVYEYDEPIADYYKNRRLISGDYAMLEKEKFFLDDAMQGVLERANRDCSDLIRSFKAANKLGFGTLELAGQVMAMQGSIQRMATERGLEIEPEDDFEDDYED